VGDSCYSTEFVEPNKIKAGDGYAIEDFVWAKKIDKDCVYPFGMDPIWYRSMQEIVFMNNFKMKISVIFGVLQMSLGTVIKGFNAVFHKNWVVLIFEVFTQITLLMCLFGFMDLLIFIKWTTDWEGYEASKNIAMIEAAKNANPPLPVPTEENGKLYRHAESAPAII
jgi:vacuolar-type H+-ATPase subunit I/STV1